MAKYEQLEATRKAARTLADSLNEAKEFPEIHSAVIDFITAMDGTTDGGTRVLGDGDFAALFIASLERRGKTAETHAIALLNSARMMKGVRWEDLRRTQAKNKAARSAKAGGQ